MIDQPRDVYATMRVLLESTEGTVHGHGWRGDWEQPVLYSLHRAPDQQLFAARRSVFTTDLRVSFAEHDGDPAVFLGQLATQYAEMRADGYPERDDQPAGPIPPDEDLTLFSLTMEGWQFHGWLVGWQYTPHGWDIAKRRFLAAYDRTGTAWIGDRPLAGSLRLKEYPVNHVDRPTGTVHHALSRMVDAVAGGPIPLITQEAPCPPEHS